MGVATVLRSVTETLLFEEAVIGITVEVVVVVVVGSVVVVVVVALVVLVLIVVVIVVVVGGRVYIAVGARDVVRTDRALVDGTVDGC